MKKVLIGCLLLVAIIPILAIGAAILIPNLIVESTNTNETAAIGSMNAIKNAQVLFSERDVDGDGKANYWVKDVFGLYAFAGTSGHALKLFRDPRLANSDAKADIDGYKIDSHMKWPTTAVPKQGYYVVFMDTDENQQPYKNSERQKYAICAYPSKYNSTGVNTFIVNEKGVVYAGDTTGHPVKSWPGEDPTTLPVTKSNTITWKIAK